MNCGEKLLEPTIFFILYTKSPEKSGSESPWRKRDLSPSILLHKKPCHTLSTAHVLSDISKDVDARLLYFTYTHSRPSRKLTS